ncbi:cyclin-dependent kinase 14 isoform X2 [Labeo rohita]|uniref:Cyclin-dependent kinase 14 isoform X2 n=1 Tax=Labeo rohita TaxID=84645 RepID=A0A498MZN7_LABRO|nr:cyclin-dependent kinase 14 isoform X2 [Labeo rohita]
MPFLLRLSGVMMLSRFWGRRQRTRGQVFTLSRTSNQIDSLSTVPRNSDKPGIMSSIFTVPTVKLQPESGDSIQVCSKTNSHGKATSNSKH